MDTDNRLESPVFTTRSNILPVTSIRSFSGIRGGNNHGRKDVYFIRCIGSDQDYITDIQDMDVILTEHSQRHLGNYLRVKELPQLTDQSQISRYSECYHFWNSGEKAKLGLDAVPRIPMLRQAMSNAFGRIKEEFLRYSPQASDSIVRNFLIKIMFWTEFFSDSLLNDWNGKKTDKFVYTGIVKKQEYLFCFFLTMLGIDVLLLSPEGELNLNTGMLALSNRILLEKQGPCSIPPVRLAGQEMKAAEPLRPVISISAINAARPSSRRPVSSNPTSGIISPNVPPAARTAEHNPAGRGKRKELEFEELARLAASVVMITMHDNSGKAVGSGSGIMIGKAGYILTNNHVASGGASFSVNMEDEENVYHTDEIIKWNSLLDLAIIRINRRITPIALYNQKEPLVRGQKVVAIGSPLGLFNSVSNGIISGFRKLGDVDMIQFTAPISHGSSGGALLNMYGEVIGISTAGFDDGQNINLAVDYRSIAQFVAGFVNEV